MLQTMQQKFFTGLMNQLQQQFHGGQIPEQHVQAAKDQAAIRTQNWFSNQRSQALQRQQASQAQVQARQLHQQQQQQMMAQMGHVPNGGMNGMGAMQ